MSVKLCKMFNEPVCLGYNYHTNCCAIIVNTLFKKNKAGKKLLGKTVPVKKKWFFENYNLEKYRKSKFTNFYCIRLVYIILFLSHSFLGEILVDEIITIYSFEILEVN